MPTVSEIGERALIQRMMRHLTPMPGMPIPFWDDVSAIKITEALSIVINTDMLVWETDVPQGMTTFQAGRKAVVMNFSDLAAKGVQPQAFMPSLGIPREYRVEDVEELARGFEAGAREYDAYVVGGDTNEAHETIISGLALGTAETTRLIKREGSRPGDILATTGLFGDTSAAFKILLEGYEASGSLRDRLLDSVYTPRARVKEGIALAESGAVTSGIDSSDGLALSLHDLRRSSGNGFRIERMPTSPSAARFAEGHDIDPSVLALYGGEEYELVFTVDPEGFETAREALRRVGCELVEMGYVTGEVEIVYLDDGIEKPILHGGWDHFKS